MTSTSSKLFAPLSVFASLMAFAEDVLGGADLVGVRVSRRG